MQWADNVETVYTPQTQFMGGGVYKEMSEYAFSSVFGLSRLSGSILDLTLYSIIINAFWCL